MLAIDEVDNPSLISRNKVEEIEKILAQEDVDLWALRELCLSEGGLVNDSIRRKVWPKLVGIDLTKESPQSKPFANAVKQKIRHLEGQVDVVDPLTVRPKGFKRQIMARSLDSRQIDLDISRCTWHLLTGTQRSRRRQMRNKHRKKIAVLLKRKQRRLGNLINLVLIQSYANSINDFDERRLRYYQGYHDISCIFLSALGGVSSPHLPVKEKGGKEEKKNNVSNDYFQQAFVASKTARAMGLELPSKVLLQISQCHLRDCMKNNFEALTTALRLIIMPLISEFDKEVHEHLRLCGMEPFFCFSWIISWFSHDIRDTSLVKRLFDVFIVSHPLMPIYMSIAMVLHPCNREEVLNTECDFASLHKTLTELPRNSCNVGWKFVGNQCGGSYVSGDEDDDVKVESASLISDDMDRESLYDEDGSLAPSLASESIFSGYDSSRVPFQELIDLSIKFMRRIPPRKLVRLAHKYHGHEVRFFSLSSSINLFQQPPDWALRASVPSDLIRSKHILKETEFDKESGSEETVTEAIYPRAAIACGIGPDGDSDSKRQRFWRRKRLQMSVVAVGIFAVVLGFTNERSQYVLGTSTIKQTAKVVLNRVNAALEVSALKSLDKLKQRAVRSDSDAIIPSSKTDNDSSFPKLQPVKFVKGIAETAKTGLADEAEVVVL